MIAQEGTSSSPGHTDVTAGGEGCSVLRRGLARIADKWSMLVIFTLEAGPLRFNELKRRGHGVSQRMLTLTLKNLERDGLVLRRVTPTVPPQVDYRLSELGVTLLVPVREMVGWAIENTAATEQAQAAYDARQGGS